jgi:hypothetical protein
VGSFVERRIYVPLLERDSGAKVVMGGHVRHQWVRQVYHSNPEGSFRARSSISVQVQDGDEELRVVIGPTAPETAATIARQVARALAATRLERREATDPDAARQLEEVANGGRPESLQWGRCFNLPAAMKVGLDYPGSPDKRARAASPPTLSPASGTTSTRVLTRAAQNVCMNSGCDASGLRTPLATCDVCGRPTVTAPEPPPAAPRNTGRTQPPAPPSPSGLYACVNDSCEAARLPTPLARCDVCGDATVPKAAASQPVTASTRDLARSAPELSCAEEGCEAYGRPARGAFCASCGSRTVAT